MSSNSVLRWPAPDDSLHYPESDGQPMAENTVQFEWIVTIKEGLEALFRHEQNVFIAGDLLWYPVQGDPTIRQAPDAMVVFDRPKGHRGSYLQWREDNIPPQVVFEVLSPGNRAGKMARKFDFYQTYGVEEYYVYDPDDGGLSGWLREGNLLRPVKEVEGWTSPRLGVKFGLDEIKLVLTGPDGKRFLSYVELVEQAEKSEQRAERLAAQLRALGVEPQD